MADLQPAARIHDPIQHSNASFGERVGAGVGALVGVIVVAAEYIVGIATVEFGVGVLVIVGATAAAVGTVAGFASAGAAIGKWIGGGSSSVQGYISSSCARTHIGPGMPKAARVGDKVDCDGSNLDQAAMTVFVEKLELSRRNSKTLCAGMVAKGCDSVAVGGPTMDLVPPDQLSEDDPVQAWTMFFVDWGGALLSLGGALIKGTMLAYHVANFGLKVASFVSEKVLGKDSYVTQGINWARVGLGMAKGGADVTKEVGKGQTEGVTKVVTAGTKSVGDTTARTTKDANLGKPKPPYDTSPQANARRAELQRRLGIQPKGFWDTRPWMTGSPTP